MKIIITFVFLMLFSLSLTAEEKNKCMDLDKLSKEFFECTKNKVSPTKSAQKFTKFKNTKTFFELFGIDKD